MSSQRKRRAIYNKSLALLTMALGLSFATSAQNVRQKLELTTDYRPRAIQPDEQLVEVARHFQIPMAIEWLDDKPPAGDYGNLRFEKGRVIDLIRSIVDRAPRQQLTVEDRIVRIYPPSVFQHELNFLNLRLKHYCVSRESVLGANFEVRVRIDAMLYPKEFKNGYNGGYGGGEKLLWIEAINICQDNVSIRNLLTEIAAQSGQAAWVAHIKPEELKGKKPFWKGVPLNEYGTSPISGHWYFFELVDSR